MDLFLSTPIEFLKGVGPQRADLLKKELNIHTFSDLLFHYPFRHIDRSMFHTIDQITDHEGFVQIKGRITGILESGVGRNKRLIAKFQD
ncbi:MAG: ATP-dependent DNA helicase RecG, partial [Crocinitomicaceae bacterium]